MKLWNHLFSLAAVLLALTVSSCKVEEPEQPFDPEEPVLVEGVTFTATTVSNDLDEETKTALSDNGNGYDVVWTADDEIVVTDGASHAGRYLLTSEPGLTTGEFTYIAQSGSPATVSGFRAWYPATVYNGGTPAYPRPRPTSRTTSAAPRCSPPATIPTCPSRTSAASSA